MSNQVAPGDQALVARWVAESSKQVKFWASAPRWTAGTAHRQLDSQLLVWTPGGIVVVGPAPSVVAVHFDGEATLAELADDLADAAEMAVEDIRPMVASVAVELQAWGAIEGVLVTAPPDSEEPDAPTGPQEYVVVESESGLEMRVEEGVDAYGNRMVTEHLPDGRRRVTSYLVYEPGHFGHAASDAEEIAAAVLAGERSAAELVPADSCLGSKLRNDDTVPLFSIRCPDGRVRSVRCHVPEVLDDLIALAGDRLEECERGPVEAFVVTPLEGRGPVRIYDARGRRRGRPRCTADAVSVVDQLLGEATARRHAGADGAIVLNAVLAVQGNAGLLIDPPLLDNYPTRQTLQRAGWTVGTGHALVVADRQVVTPSILGSSTRIPVDRVRLGTHSVATAAALVPRLVGDLASDLDADDALDLLVQVAEALLTVDDEPVLPVLATAEGS